MLRMFLITVLIVLLLGGYQVSGVDLNSAIPRTNCYPNEQPGCNEEFIDVYKNLSMSATNLTKADTWFWLFTRKNPDRPEKLEKCGGKLPPNSNFNPNNRLILILVPFIFGYCDNAVSREWTAQYLLRADVNVMAVDYSWGNHIEYTEAYRNSEIVADQTTIVLRNIQFKTGIKKDKIYLIGLSLGAQLAGLIGYRFPVYRITGLDPANPLYHKDRPLKDRLDPTDADLVDVWHTNMGRCLPDLGIDYDAGHANFYINGGHDQPPCHEYAFISILKGDLLYGIGTAVYPELCSHVMSSQYYKVSINPGNCQFVAVKCKNYEEFKSGRCRSCGRHGQNCMIMGYDFDKYYVKNSSQFPQKYFIDTSMHCPYCDNSKIRLQGFSRTYRSSLQSPNDEGKCSLEESSC